MITHVDQAHAIKDLKHDIQVALIRHDLSIPAAAKSIGIDARTLRNWVSHPESLSIPKWQRLNSVLHISPDSYIRAAGFNQRGQ